VAARLTPPVAAGQQAPRPESFADQLWQAVESSGRPSRPTARGLPVARLISPIQHSLTHYAVTTMDIWGRLADRSSLRVLQWRPGRPVTISIVDGAVVVAACHRLGRSSITRQGHLRLPASVRHQCRLDAGDRLLLVACPDRGLLLAYPTPVLDTMVLAYHATLTGGTPR
jgi:hypothetical protein